MLSFYLSLLSDPADKSRFAAIYEKYSSLMYQIAFRELRNIAEAEDLAHDAFLRLAQNMEKVGSVEDRSTVLYLTTILHNLIIDHHRKRQTILAHVKYQTKDDDVDIVSVLPDKAPPPFQQLRNRQVKEALLQAMEKLTPYQRQTLTLYYFRDMSAAEVAKSLGISLNSAYKRIESARHALRKILQEEGFDAEDL